MNDTAPTPVLFAHEELADKVCDTIRNIQIAPDGFGGVLIIQQQPDNGLPQVWPIFTGQFEDFMQALSMALIYFSSLVDMPYHVTGVRFAEIFTENVLFAQMSAQVVDIEGNENGTAK